MAIKGFAPDRRRAPWSPPPDSRPSVHAMAAPIADPSTVSRATDAPEDAPAVSVVVPVRDEAENVVPLIEEIDAALRGQVAYEIVYVDDGSVDATPDRLREAAATRPWVRIVRHRDACGQSTAIASGVEAARAPVVATLDGDGQNDPADIPALLSVHGEAGDSERVLVTGLRAKRRDSWVKRASSRIANGVRSRMLGDNTPDTGCGLKVFNRSAFLSMPRFDHMHCFLPALMLRLGGRVVSVPVNHRPRERGDSKYGTLDRLFVGITDLFGVMWLKRRSRVPVIESDPEGNGR